MRVLIGYDGSDCADTALDDLARAALPPKVEALVLSVADVWLPPPSSYEILESIPEVQVPQAPMYAGARAKAEAALNWAREGQKRLQTRFPGWEVAAESSCGSPAWEIIARADQWKPALVVVGSHGRSALGRFVLGSVAQRVVTEAHCSVRVARAGIEDPHTAARVIVGLDGSPGSESAVREIVSRSWPKGSEVRLVVAHDPLSPTFIGELIPGVAQTIDESNQADRIWIEKILERSKCMLRESGLAISTKIQDGDPKRVLVQEAEEWRAHCIFVGSTGFSNRIERFVLGSVSAAVVARAHCSVEVVR